MVPILLEEMGSGLEDVIVSQWHVTEGDAIQEGLEVAEVLTDKVSINVMSPVSGRIVELLHNQGDRVVVGDTLAMVDEEDIEQMDQGAHNA